MSRTDAAHALQDDLRERISRIERDGLFKTERVIVSPQSASVRTADAKSLVNLCANNYLGLADHPRLVAAAAGALGSRGFGMASVRFICGTQDLHRDLEARISTFLGTEDTVLYNSCFDANGGFFEALLDEQDAIISDSLNHASIIDGIRLCKARRRVYANNDMADLERQLRETRDARYRLIATDGVFSMDGIIANLAAICELAERYDALVFVDDSHAVGVLGPNGRGTPALFGVSDRVSAVSGTLGKALGGAAGGYIATRGPIAAWLRQRSRPYLFSNSLPPPITAAALAAFDLVEEGDGLRRRLNRYAERFRKALTDRGFRLLGHGHPIIPVFLGEAKAAAEMALRLLDEGIYVIGFSYPVVPNGQARIRTQMSAALSDAQLDRAIEAFAKVGKELRLI